MTRRIRTLLLVAVLATSSGAGVLTTVASARPVTAGPAARSTARPVPRAAHRRPPGRRIVRIARRYVGARYRSGGASPRRGFDCSGYTLYVYRRAGVARLPHNAEGQRRLRHMRRIPRRRARPGDLIFYMSGGHAYHVAIYAGHDSQFAATEPGEGVRHQRIWSRAIQFRTDWH